MCVPCLVNQVSARPHEPRLKPSCSFMFILSNGVAKWTSRKQNPSVGKHAEASAKAIPACKLKLWMRKQGISCRVSISLERRPFDHGSHSIQLHVLFSDFGSAIETLHWSTRLSLATAFPLKTILPCRFHTFNAGEYTNLVGGLEHFLFSHILGF